MPIHEALKAVTIDAAWQIHKDDTLGSLMENKIADLLILSKNPLEVMLIIVACSRVSLHEVSFVWSSGIVTIGLVLV